MLNVLVRGLRTSSARTAPKKNSVFLLISSRIRDALPRSDSNAPKGFCFTVLLELEKRCWLERWPASATWLFFLCPQAALLRSGKAVDRKTCAIYSPARAVTHHPS